MELSVMREAVRVWLRNRPEATNTLIDSIINKVYLSMAMPFRFHETESEYLLDTVAGTREYALDSSTMYALHTAYDRQYGQELEVVDINQLDRIIDTEDYEGSPRKIARYGSGVKFDIAPDYTLTDGIILRGLSLPTELVDDADEPVYPKDWHWIIELQAASVLAFMFDMDERGQLLQNIALGQLTGRQESHTLEAFTKQMQILTGRPKGRNGSVEIRGS